MFTGISFGVSNLMLKKLIDESSRKSELDFGKSEVSQRVNQRSPKTIFNNTRLYYEDVKEIYEATKNVKIGNLLVENVSGSEYFNLNIFKDILYHAGFDVMEFGGEGRNNDFIKGALEVHGNRPNVDLNTLSSKQRSELLQQNELLTAYHIFKSRYKDLSSRLGQNLDTLPIESINFLSNTEMLDIADSFGIWESSTLKHHFEKEHTIIRFEKALLRNGFTISNLSKRQKKELIVEFLVRMDQIRGIRKSKFEVVLDFFGKLLDKPLTIKAKFLLPLSDGDHRQISGPPPKEPPKLS
jgi:hypothetical protein